MNRTLGLVFLLTALCVSAAQAEEPSPCEAQLLVKSVHDQLLTQKRAQVEDELAKTAADALRLQREVQQLRRELAALKPAETPVPPPESH